MFQQIVIFNDSPKINCQSYSRRLPGLRSSASWNKSTNQLPLPSGTGQASAPIRRFATLRRPVFLINSRLGLVTASSLTSSHPFSRSYGAILPSSLERVISRPLVFSTYLPVSVSGTGSLSLTVLRAFLGSLINRLNSCLISKIVFLRLLKNSNTCAEKSNSQLTFTFFVPRYQT